ncbi:unnamed protein product [Lampetra fluviatilis]
MKETNRFGLASGLKVNARKSELMAFGDPRLFEGRPPELGIKTEEVKVLGVSFCRERSAERNWDGRIKQEIPHILCHARPEEIELEHGKGLVNPQVQEPLMSSPYYLTP